MLPGDIDNFDDYQWKSGVGQTNSILGYHKGIVLDTRDPFRFGRVRVHCYGLHADYPGLDVGALFWADVAQPLRGAFGTLRRWDRVWITFEANDRNSPIVVGYWYGAPTGSGSLPHNRGVGSEVRPENWLQHDLQPESIMLAMSGNGNGMWLEDKFINKTVLSCLIATEDTGGKFFNIKSFHQTTTDYDSEVAPPVDLYGADLPERTVLRDGITPVTDAVSGEVSFGHQNVSRALVTDTEDFTLDSVVITDENGVAAVEQTVAGSVMQKQIGKSSIVQMDDAIFLNSPLAIFAPNLKILPRRWD